MSVTVSPPRRIRYKLSWHSIQHSLDVSLMKLHMTKPTQGTHGMNPTPAYFDIVTGYMIRTKICKRLSLFWMLETLSYQTIPQCLCPNTIQLYRKRISFLPVQINWSTASFYFFILFFIFWKSGVYRNSVVCCHTLYLPIMDLFL